MWKYLFSDMTLLELPLVVMLGFMAMFFATLYWVFSRRRVAHYETMASLPLFEPADAAAQAEAQAQAQGGER